MQLESAGLIKLHRNRGVFVANTRNSDAYYYENERFHHVIYETCDNAYPADHARELHQRLRPYRRLQLRTPHRVTNSLREHQSIVDAIVAGDSEMAQRLLRDHMLTRGERLTDFIVSFDMIAAS